jgi:hypothetical protein
MGTQMCRLSRGTVLPTLALGAGLAHTMIGTDKRGGRLVRNVTWIEVRGVDSPPRTGS